MPVYMPAYGFTGIGPLPDIGVASARTEGGLVITSRNSDPFWKGTMSTRRLSGLGTNEYADFVAFLSRCVDLNLRVDFVHPLHRLPSAYNDATWPMIGDAALADVVDLRTIRLSGLPVGLTLRRGDRLSIMQGDLIGHRWIASPLTVSSTIAQDIEITPRLPLGVFAPGAAVALKDPKMRFMIVPGSWDTTEARDGTPVSFEVAEALR